MLTLDLGSIKSEYHPFVPVEGCSQCSGIEGNALEIVSVDSNQCAVTWDGGHRLLQPEETLRWLERLCSPLLGVIHDTQELTSPSSPVHVYSAPYVIAPAEKKEEEVAYPWYHLALGKGQTAEQAKVSAMSEAVERMAGYYRGSEYLTYASLNGLGDQAIHPNACMLYSSAQFFHRHEINQKLNHLAGHVPEPFPEESVVPWAPVTLLESGEVHYLPAAYCYYGFVDASAAYCRMDYNGHAAGHSVEEALLQGFLELVERDSIALWWYNRVNRPAVDLDSFAMPYIERLQAYYASIKRRFWVLDLTADFKIPAFVALSVASCPEYENEPILYGTAAHFDARIALSRALTEMNQALPDIHAARSALNGKRWGRDNKRMDRWPSSKASTLNYFLPDLSRPSVTRNAFPELPYTHIEEAMQCIIDAVSEKDLRLYYLDQTRADLGLHAVKVVVPGLRPYWPRFAPGRLFSAPVDAGWTTRFLAENELNPDPITR